MLANKIRQLFKIFSFFPEYGRDLWLFLRHNSFSPLEDRERRLAYRTIIETHTIEKGLALPVPKPHFGQDKIRALIGMNRMPVTSHLLFSRSMLVGALQDYAAVFKRETAPDPVLADKIRAFISTEASTSARGGVRLVNELPRGPDPMAISFLEKRFSARDFDTVPLNIQEIEAVVSLAQRAPSQCNRQATRLHVYREPVHIRTLLKLQGGANGFLENVPTLFVVTSEITAWGGPQQRNQPYVDGGIFATMLLLALGAHGFFSCPLNLAVDNKRERQIKANGNIPGRERLVVMVAAGHPPAHAPKAAQSPRLDVGSIVTIHDE